MSQKSLKSIYQIHHYRYLNEVHKRYLEHGRDEDFNRLLYIYDQLVEGSYVKLSRKLNIDHDEAYSFILTGFLYLIKRFRHNSSINLTTYLHYNLMTVAEAYQRLNKSFDYVDISKLKEVLTNDDFEDLIQNNTNTISTNLAEEIVDDLYKLIQKRANPRLKERTSDIFILKYGYKLTQEEIALIVNLSQPRVSQILEQIKEIIDPIIREVQSDIHSENND